jgi:hypothetical protein
MNHFWVLPLALIAAVGMTACATAVDAPMDEATTDEVVASTQERDCFGVTWCTDDSNGRHCNCFGFGSVASETSCHP